VPEAGLMIAGGVHQKHPGTDDLAITRNAIKVIIIV
jgi:hypothetical protein